MSDMTRVALDAMGGDNAPGEIVKGAVDAVNSRKEIEVILTGKEESPAPEGAGLTQEFARIFDQLSPQAQNEIIAEMLKRKRQEQ